MRLNKIKVSVFLMISVCFLSLLYTARSVAAQNDPIALLQSIADNMIAGLKTNQATLKTKPEVVYRLARQYVVPHANLNEMSKRVLPPAIWNAATPSERSRFQQAFTTTLIRTYASALTSYQDQTIQFFPIRGNYQQSDSITVNSEIRGGDHQPIQVSYRLLRQGDNWKLYDMSVEGVSMLDSFRAQFADILSHGNINDLLKRMTTHNKGSN